jgi:hypothetical protein
MSNEAEPEENLSQPNAPEEISPQEAECDHSVTQQILGEEQIAATENAVTKEQVSQKKLEANRNNAKLSRGPITPEGKKRSSRNATTHGLLVQDVVIKTGAGQENETEFEALLAELRDAYQPVGIVEDLKVRELTISYWKTARALRSERGAITVDTRTVPDQPELTDDPFEISKDAEARHMLLATSRGLRFLLRKIEDTKWEVKSSGSISEQSRRWLSPREKWQGLYKKASILAALENEAEELTKRKVQIEQEEAEQKQARLELSAIPSTTALNTIQRYEKDNVRHRHTVEQTLQELQSRRRAGKKENPESEGRPN